MDILEAIIACKIGGGRGAGGGVTPADLTGVVLVDPESDTTEIIVPTMEDLAAVADNLQSNIDHVGDSLGVSRTISGNDITLPDDAVVDYPLSNAKITATTATQTRYNNTYFTTTNLFGMVASGVNESEFNGVRIKSNGNGLMMLNGTSGSSSFKVTDIISVDPGKYTVYFITNANVNIVMKAAGASTSMTLQRTNKYSITVSGSSIQFTSSFGSYENFTNAYVYIGLLPTSKQLPTTDWERYIRTTQFGLHSSGLGLYSITPSYAGNITRGQTTARMNINLYGIPGDQGEMYYDYIDFENGRIYKYSREATIKSCDTVIDYFHSMYCAGALSMDEQGHKNAILCDALVTKEVHSNAVTGIDYNGHEIEIRIDKTLIPTYSISTVNSTDALSYLNAYLAQNPLHIVWMAKEPEVIDISDAIVNGVNEVLHANGTDIHHLGTANLSVDYKLSPNEYLTKEDIADLKDDIADLQEALIGVDAAADALMEVVGV